MPARLLRESWNFSRRSAESEIATGKLSTLTAMANSTSPSDEQLLHLMMNGDEEAFVVLYQRRQGGVYRFALHMSGSETTAEDVTQEVFLALLRSARNFDPGKGALVSFLYGIARNQVLRRLERDRPFLSLADRESDEVEVMAQDYTTRDPLNDLTRTELIEGVRQAILTLPSIIAKSLFFVSFMSLATLRRRKFWAARSGQSDRACIGPGRCLSTGFVRATR